MYADRTVTEQRALKYTQWESSGQVTLWVILSIALCLAFLKYNTDKSEEKQTLSLTYQPQINDIYFLDFRLLRGKLTWLKCI